MNSCKYTESDFGFMFSEKRDSISLDCGESWFFFPLTVDEFYKIFGDCMTFFADGRDEKEIEEGRASLEYLFDGYSVDEPDTIEGFCNERDHSEDVLMVARRSYGHLVYICPVCEKRRSDLTQLMKDLAEHEKRGEALKKRVVEQCRHWGVGGWHAYPYEKGLRLCKRNGKAKLRLDCLSFHKVETKIKKASSLKDSAK